MRQQPFSNRFEICREIKLGHRNAVTRVRPKRLIRFGDGYSQDGRCGRTSRRTRLRSTVQSGILDRAQRLRLNFAGRLVLTRPLNDACRTIPSPVNPAYSISATKSGLTQCTSLPPGGAPLPEKGLLEVAVAFNSGMRRFTEPVP